MYTFEVRETNIRNTFFYLFHCVKRVNHWTELKEEPSYIRTLIQKRGPGNNVFYSVLMLLILLL